MDPETATLDRSAAYIETQQRVAAIAELLTSQAQREVGSQWEVLGAGPGSDESRSGAIIDPEALLLMSLWLAPRDAALRSAAHEWVARWSDLLSVQRTRNIAKGFSDVVHSELYAVAVTAHERGKDFRWTPVIAGGAGSGAAPDAATAAFDKRLPQGADRLAVERDALLVLRFRMAFGVGARADALAYLLARSSAWSSVTEIAQATGYTPSAIRRALDRMAEADIVLSVDDGTTRFRCDATPWAALLGLQATVAPWQYWLQRFVFVATFVEWAESLSLRKVTAYTITESLRGVARAFRPSDDHDALRAWEHSFRDGSSLDEMVAALQGVLAAAV